MECFKGNIWRQNNNPVKFVIGGAKQVLMQLDILEWILGTDFGFLITAALVFVGFILLLTFCIQRSVRIFPPDWHIIHYRRGKLLKQYKNGGMLVMIPFFDVLKGKPGPFDAEPPEFLDGFNEWGAEQAGKE